MIRLNIYPAYANMGELQTAIGELNGESLNLNISHHQLFVIQKLI